jgi:hypothetical protein
MQSLRCQASSAQNTSTTGDLPDESLRNRTREPKAGLGEALSRPAALRSGLALSGQSLRIAAGYSNVLGVVCGWACRATPALRTTPACGIPPCSHHSRGGSRSDLIRRLGPTRANNQRHIYLGIVSGLTPASKWQYSAFQKCSFFLRSHLQRSLGLLGCAAEPFSSPSLC